MTRYVGELVTNGSFTDRDTGAQVNFENHYMHFVTDQPEHPDFIGEETFVAKTSKRLYDQIVDPKLKPGMLCDVRYARDGKLIAVKAVSDPAGLMRK